MSRRKLQSQWTVSGQKDGKNHGSLLVVSSFDMLSLHSPKSHSAM